MFVNIIVKGYNMYVSQNPPSKILYSTTMLLTTTEENLSVSSKWEGLGHKDNLLKYGQFIKI